MPTSYAWAHAIKTTSVEPGGVVTVLTPGMAEPEKFDTAGAQVVHDGTVLQPEEFALTWADDFSSVEVENKDDETWQPGDTIYITVTALPSGDITALEAQVAAHEGEINILHSRVKDCEAAIADLQTRVTALENPPAPSQ